MTQTFPQTFGPYVLERFVAAGGMAEVFLARRPDGRVPGNLALKRMLPEMTKTPEYVTMFRDECALSQRLVHPNIVRVFDYGELDQRMYMAMEYVDGLDVGSLQRRLKKRNELLGVPHALKVGIELCAGLHYAHTLVDEKRRPLKLIHRDVSPQNILVSSSGQVKITDFGIAKAVGRETNTATGLIKGKIAYMAPEQALGQHIDQRIDQFAAGIVVWEMVTGQRLFQEKSDLLTFEKIIRHPTAKPSSVRPGVPGFVDQVILRALAKSPDERYPDMAAFGAALTQALAQLGGPQKADLAPVISYVMSASGELSAPSPVAPPPSSPPPQVTALGPAAAFGELPTRAATPRSAQPASAFANTSVRLPTAAMTPLPAPPVTGSEPTPRTGTRSGSGSGSGIRVFGAPSGDQTQALAQEPAPLTLATRPLAMPVGIESSAPSSSPASPPGALNGLNPGSNPSLMTPGMGPRPQTSTGMVAAAPSRGTSIPLVVGALVVGVALGFGGAKLTAKPAKSSADCGTPSMESSQQAADLLKRADEKWRDSDFIAARRMAREANEVHASPAAHMLLARMALSGGDRLEALTHFRCVVALDPAGPVAADLEKQLKAPVR